MAWPKYIIFELKNYIGVMFDGTEYWCKIWRKIDLCFQKWHKGFSKFSPEYIRKSKNWGFDGILLSKVGNVWLKIYKGVMYHENEEWFEIWRGIDLSVQNWHEEFDELWLEHSKISKICTLMDCHWPKYIMLELKKVQRSYAWRHWLLMQNLKENWFVLSKVTWRIWQIFIHRLKNSDFILESKMDELNQNQNWKQPDRPDAVWKIYFTLKVNK